MSDKEYVSRLIVSVLTSKISVKDAIILYPKNSTDKDILAAYHALLHYEADEDLRSKDIAFKEEQDEYLNMIAELFVNNKNLPLNIIKSYEKYYPEINLPKPQKIKKLISKICNFLNIK